MKRLVVLDQRWHSALTDLGVKIASVLDGEVACAVLENSPAEKLCKKLGLPVFYIDDPRKGLPFVPFLSLKKVVRQFEPEVVLTIRGDEMLFASILKSRFGFKLYRLHGEAKGIKDSFLNKWLHKRFVDGVLLSSKKLKGRAVEGIPSIYVRGAVDSKRFVFSPEGRGRIRREFGFRDSDLVLGLVARFDPVKGHRVFLSALSILKEKFPVKALIVGEEKNVSLKELKMLAEELRVVDITHFVTERREDIVDIISSIDIGVVSSVGSEVIARVVLEYMSCSRPVVVTNVGVLPEIVDSAVGAVTRPTAESLAEGVKRVLTGDVEAMGKMARRRVEEVYSLNVLKRSVDRFLV